MAEFCIDSYSRPSQGEHRNGDLLFSRALSDTRRLLLLADMAGHGDAAYRDSLVIKRWLVSMSVTQPVKLAIDLHAQLLNRRHASLIAGILDSGKDSFEYIHVGNLYGKLESRDGETLTGQDGSVGLNLPKLELRQLYLQMCDRLIFCTDGIEASWTSMTAVPGITGTNKNKTAREIVQSYGKPHDDATCIIVTPT